VALFLVPSLQAAPTQVTGGSLDWGLKESFRSYITGPIAQGTISVSGGTIRNADGTFKFPAASGSYDNAAGTATLSFGGAVRFLGHNGELDMTLSNLRIVLNGTTGTLTTDIVSDGATFSNTAFVTLDLTGISPTVSGNRFTWTGVPTSLTPPGSTAFSGFYPAGQVMDPISFTLDTGAAATPTTGPTATVTTPTATPTRTLVSPTSGLAWKVSQLAWTSSSLVPSRSVIAPATIDQDNGFVFPVTQATYTPSSGVAAINFAGSATMGNTAQGNFRITLANPSVTIDASGAGQLQADVSYCLVNCSTQPVVVGPTRVVVATFQAGPSSLTVSGNHASGVLSLDYPLQNNPAQPTFRQFPQSFLNALDPGLQAFFRDSASASGVPSASNPLKPPAPIALGFDFTQPAASPTATNAPAGGRGLGISSGSGGVGLSWQGGQGQGYAVARLANGAVTVPAPSLPANTTSFLDTTAPPGLDCYAVFTLGLNPQGQSDLECALMGFHSATGSPDGFILRLNQSSTASLSWAPPPGGGQDSYLLVTIGGAADSLPASATSATRPMNGLTCFALGAMRNGVLTGYTDILCGLPGFSNLGATATSAGASVRAAAPTPTPVRGGF
jgi:hypothetical protein